MQLVNKFKSYINKNNRIFTIDKIHGVNVIQKIIKPFINAYNDEGVKILITGDEMDRQLDKADIPHNYATDYFERRRKKDEYQYKPIEKIPSVDLVILWAGNFIFPRYIRDIQREFHSSVLVIGDSFMVDYFSNGNIIRFLRDSDHYMDKIDGLPDFSQQLLFFANRIRNGEEAALENKDNGAYSITDQSYKLDELFEYDVNIVAAPFIGEMNRDVREDLLEYRDILPREEERLVPYEMIRTKDVDGNKITIQIGQELLVKSVKKDIHGVVTCVCGYGNTEVELWVNMDWIADMYGVENLDYVVGGHKLFYSYLIPPDLSIDKSYDSVFHIMKNLDMNNKRTLYSCVKSARKKIKIHYNTNSSLLY